MTIMLLCPIYNLFVGVKVLKQRLAFRPLSSKRLWKKNVSFTQSSLRLNPEVTVASLSIISRFSLLYIVVSNAHRTRARGYDKKTILHIPYVHAHYNNI